MKAVPIIFIYCLVSVVLFATAILLIPGFPFSPEDVFRTTDEIQTVELKKGGYAILYYIAGKRDIAVTNDDVGKIDLQKLGPRNLSSPIELVPEDYIFDNAPDDPLDIHGQAVCGFFLPDDEKIQITSHFRKFGYDGLIVRTSMKKFIISVMSTEIIILLVTTLLILAGLMCLQRYKLRSTRQPERG